MKSGVGDRSLVEYLHTHSYFLSVSAIGQMEGSVSAVLPAPGKFADEESRVSCGADGGAGLAVPAVCRGYDGGGHVGYNRLQITCENASVGCHVQRSRAHSNFLYVTGVRCSVLFCQHHTAQQNSTFRVQHRKTGWYKRVIVRNQDSSMRM